MHGASYEKCKLQYKTNSFKFRLQYTVQYTVCNMIRIGTYITFHYYSIITATQIRLLCNQHDLVNFNIYYMLLFVNI